MCGYNNFIFLKRQSVLKQATSAIALYNKITPKSLLNFPFKGKLKQTGN